MFSERKRKGASIAAVLPYTTPKLHTGKNWYIDFCAFDPVEQKMRRKKYMLDSLATKTAKKNRATELITNLNMKLRSGWNPWADALTARQYTKFDDCIEYYCKYLDKLHKSGAIKDNTLLDYNKRIRMLRDYNNNHITPIMYVYQLDTTYASDFLDYILIDRDSSARTRNNYKVWLTSFCNWLIEKGYLEQNPIDKIKAIAEGEKKRCAFTPEDLAKFRNYLQQENPYFLLLCSFAYYTFIRPVEITNIRLKDINISEQKVYVSSSISKNRRDGMVGLNDSVLKMMIELDVFAADNDCYLFGPGFKPSRTQASTKIYRNYFNKVRDKLKFPDSYQFYSLKDTGIRDLANAAGIVVARDQARHADVSTTNKYLKGEALTVHEETKHFKGAL